MYLLKSGRILQYRQQNVAILSAPEGAEFEIFYSRRWLPPDLEITTGDGAVVVFADSPYTRLDPVRYATVVDARQNHAGLDLRIRCGPHVVVTDTAALIPPAPRHPAGGRHFAWRGDGSGLRPPRSDEELHDAWRDAIDRLRGNAFYERSHFARLVSVTDTRGHDVTARRLPLGATATVHLEVHSPVDDRHVTIVVDTDPPGTATGGVDDAPVGPGGRITVPVRPLAAGPHHVELSFAPEPLLSTRLTVELEVHPGGTGTTTSAGAPATTPGLSDGHAPDARLGPRVDPDAVVALARRLNRLDPDPEQYLEILHDHVLPLAPDHPVLRSLVAAAAFDLDQHELVVELLDEPSRLRPGDAFHRLISGLHTNQGDDIGAYLRSIDFGVDQTVADLRVQLLRLPAGALRSVVDALLDELAGDELLDRLLRDVFDRLGDDLALRVASECGPADPDAWLHAVLARWPQPHDMPDRALELLVDWDIRDAALQRHLGEAIERALEDGDPRRAAELRHRARDLLPDRELTELRLALAHTLRRAGNDADALSELLAAGREVAGLCDPDLCAAVRTALHETARAADPDPDLTRTVDETLALLDGFLDESEAVRDYRDARDHDACRRLRRFTNGKVLHLVGAKRCPWADEIEECLGLKRLVWHESEPGRSPPMDWTSGLDPDASIVVVFWQKIGHQTTASLDEAGIDYLLSKLGRRHLLETLEVHFGLRPRPTG